MLLSKCPLSDIVAKVKKEFEKQKSSSNEADQVFFPMANANLKFVFSLPPSIVVQLTKTSFECGATCSRLQGVSVSDL